MREIGRDPDSGPTKFCCVPHTLRFVQRVSVISYQLSVQYKIRFKILGSRTIGSSDQELQTSNCRSGTNVEVPDVQKDENYFK